MSTNKLSHLQQGEKIYLEVERELSTSDDDSGLMFRATSSYATFVDDDDTFYTLDDLRQLANDGMPNGNMPKQGEMIEVRDYEGYWDKRIFVSFYKGKVIAANEFDSVSTWDEWRPFQQKTELTLAEVEERLGMEKGSLIII